jgi:hypothetical protein
MELLLNFVNPSDIFSLGLFDVLRFDLFVTSLVHMIYKHQLEAKFREVFPI